MTSAFYVYGDPVPQGSMKCWGRRGDKLHALESSNKDTLLPWRDKITAAAKRDYPDTGPVIRFPQYAPVSIEITYSLPRPANHHGTGRNAGTVKSSAPQYPTAKGTGDIDKLERAVLDALTAAGVLHDDAQVIDVTHRKRYVEPDPWADERGDVLTEPGIVVRLYPGGDR
jgi:crossover junction endodeoxyribonuclease RusA